MATVSIEKGISLNIKAVDNILKLFETKDAPTIERENVNVMDEVQRGNDLLNQLFSH